MGNGSSPPSTPQAHSENTTASIPSGHKSSPPKLQRGHSQYRQTPLIQQTLGNTVAATSHVSYGPPPIGPGPYAMNQIANALPHGGFHHSPMTDGHRLYSHQFPPYPGGLHVRQSHPESIMAPLYYMQHPQVPHYHTQVTVSSIYGQHPMQGPGNFSFHQQTPWFVDHLRSQGYYQQVPNIHGTDLQMTHHMNRQYSCQGNTQQDTMTLAQRPIQRRVSSWRNPSSPPVDMARRNTVRGHPRRHNQSGHAVWIGNLPPSTDLMSLVAHVCTQAPQLRSVFLITKSNCAFANFREEHICVHAQKAIHESTFRSVRLVCRLRKDPSESTESPVVIAAGTSNPAVSASYGGQIKATLPAAMPYRPDALDPIEAEPSHGNRGSNDDMHRDRFFVLKSLTCQDLEQSVKTGVWVTQSHNEDILDDAFKTTDSVYLIFSANKSGEFFGFARMTSKINRDPEAAIQFTPQSQAVDKNDMAKTTTVEARDAIPKGRIVDDSARGTILWEADDDDDDDDVENASSDVDESELAAKAKAKETDQEETVQTLGKPFRLQWLSTVRLPFYRTRGLRNPWNSNREVKIARDGTEIEPFVGRRLIELLNNNASPGYTRA